MEDEAVGIGDWGYEKGDEEEEERSRQGGGDDRKGDGRKGLSEQKHGGIQEAQGRKPEEWLGVGDCLEDYPVLAGKRGGQVLGNSRRENEYRGEKVIGTTALTRNKAQLFPTTRCPILRSIVSEQEVSWNEITEWYQSTALRLGRGLTPSQQAKAKRMLYTWRDVFETDLLRIRQTDLVEHAIILEPGAKAYCARIPLYTEEEIAFCKRLLPKMKEAGLIYQCDSE